MITESVSAWLIHKKWAGESSAIVYFYTETYGMMVCRYRGCRTHKKKASLLPFTPLHASFHIKNDWYHIQSIEMIDAPLELSGASLFSAFYVNELLFYTSRALEPNPRLYQQYAMTLKSLTKACGRQDIEQALRHFEWVFLKESGYEIPTDYDMAGERIHPMVPYIYYPGDGLQKASQGVLGAYLISMAEGVRLDDEGLKSIKPFMRRAIDHVLDGRVIKARDLFKTT
tara:strand:+ start:1173 stop:1856 length:684 start_codon:yes stop_codon:yes gene_type:complete